MELEDILTKEAIDEIYKDIYASREYRKLADKYQKLKMQGNITQALIYAKKMKAYEIGVFEGIARRYIDANRIAFDVVSAMPKDDRKTLSVLTYAVYMLSDVLESYIMDINRLMKKNTDRNVHGFDKLNEAIKEAKKVVTHFDKLINDKKTTTLFGYMTDDLYKLIFNKSSSYYNKLNKYAEDVDKKAASGTEVA